ncbi:uridine kinase family protein [Bacillus suaedae]|uniref:Phosphoribulokinase n=1 Tax=Halalkalibacter suaedae TaxID=2822140 RepID=A0A940WWP8_9BACI|nr:phosphoribulokinase [Bacillus suaedae]
MENILNKLVDLINSKQEKIIIGISGHGASGKTMFARKLIKLLEHEEVSYINTDPYIIGSHLRKHTSINYDYMNEQHQGKMTACHPAAHNIYALERDIQMMRAALDFYTIGTHYSESKFISSQNRVSIIEGMTVAFTDPELYDLRIYLYTDGETELMRRGIRDVSERGTDLNYLRNSHDERRIQYDLFMHPFHQNFDLVIKNSNENYTLEKDCFK